MYRIINKNIKLAFFINDMIAHIENNSEESTNKLLG